MYRGAHTDVFVDVNGHVVRGRSGFEGSRLGGDVLLGDDVYVIAPPGKLRVLPRGVTAPGEPESAEGAEQA